MSDMWEFAVVGAGLILLGALQAALNMGTLHEVMDEDPDQCYRCKTDPDHKGPHVYRQIQP